MKFPRLNGKRISAYAESVLSAAILDSVKTRPSDRIFLPLMHLRESLGSHEVCERVYTGTRHPGGVIAVHSLYQEIDERLFPDTDKETPDG